MSRRTAPRGPSDGHCCPINLNPQASGIPREQRQAGLIRDAVAVTGLQHTGQEDVLAVVSHLNPAIDCGGEDNPCIGIGLTIDASAFARTR